MARQHPRTIAYLRVSTHEQDVAKNQTDIRFCRKFSVEAICGMISFDDQR